MKTLNTVVSTINLNKLKLSFTMAMVLLVVLDLIEPNLIAKIHVLHFSLFSYLQVKVAYLTLGLLFIGTLTYLTTPKAL